MNILYVTTIGGTMVFFESFIKDLLDNGIEVDIACNNTQSPVPVCYSEWKVPIFPISCSRSPLSKSNVKAYKHVKHLIDNGGYDIIHCHTPVAAFLTRLAARKSRKHSTRVIYTAHGFHFFKGAPLFNWLVYFPIEWLSSFFTDDLITINQEDYAFAKNHLHAKNTHYVHGVGINLEKFKNPEFFKEEKLKELNIPLDATILLSVGELNKNKNHEVILQAMSKIENKNIHYCIAGKGPNEQYLLELAKTLDLSDHFHLLGYRKDINELLACSDVFCFPSFREGLPVSLMEAMAAGLPVVCSKIRGNVDLIGDGQGGFLCDPLNPDEFAEKIAFLLDNPEQCEGFCNYNKNIINSFIVDAVNNELNKIYFSK